MNNDSEEGIPPFFYKYRSLQGFPCPSKDEQCVLKYRNEKGLLKDKVPPRLRTRDIIINSEIYFSSPKDFNDPFDSKLYLPSEATLAEVYDFSWREANKDYNATDAEKEETALRIQGGWLVTTKEERQEFLNTLPEKLMNPGVFSMSSKRDNILMWSHYANNHEGICLEFDSSLSLFKDEPQQIIYRDEFPHHWVFSGKSVGTAQALITKYKDWGYEKEWRLIRRASGSKKFLPKALTGIILGYAISPSDKEDVLEWVKKSKSTPKIYQATRNIQKFALDIVEVK